MSKWREIYWNDFKSFVRKHGLAIITVVVLVTINYYARALANAKDGYIQELEQYVKLLEDKQQEATNRLIILNEEIDFLIEDNQILGSYLAEKEIQYEQ
tara:strand:- start:665 stop:961 length:297 start_codon:yes stop_codon:yes gene_type:complete